MKTKQLFSSATSAIAIFAYALPASAQSEDITRDAAKEPAVATANTGGDKATRSVVYANLASQDEDSKVTGNLKFTMSGDAASVSGRITGLESGETYQLSTTPAPSSGKEATAADGNADESTGNDLAPPPSEAGEPNAGKPMAPAPNAGTPNAGQPNGEFRSNTSSPTALNPTDKNVIGTVVADSTGSTNVNAVLRTDAISQGLQNLIGKTVNLRRGDGAEMKIVATGVITAEEGKSHHGIAGAAIGDPEMGKETTRKADLETSNPADREEKPKTDVDPAKESEPTEQDR